MTCIPIPTDLAFRLLDEVSRRRALADDESELLEAIVTRGHQSAGVKFRWTAKIERELWQASYRKGTIRAFAQKHGIGEKACYDKLVKMRRAKADRKAQSPKQGGKG